LGGKGRGDSVEEKLYWAVEFDFLTGVLWIRELSSG
jgi:hypothetical protein